MIGRIAAAFLIMTSAAIAADPPQKAEGVVRVAAFNVALNRRNPGELAQELRLGVSAQVDAVVEIIQRVRPDIILINEIDHDARQIAAQLFRDALKVGRQGGVGINYPHLFTATSNTGVSSGFDLDKDGRVFGPKDAFGFGYFEGQYGMALLSLHPIEQPRTFQDQRWADMLGHLIPMEFYGEAATSLRLSSKSHWDAPVTLPDGRTIHILASHPTPPVFDSPVNENGRRNHDEIRFWVDYVTGRDWMRDDAGVQGGLAPGAGWAVLGDLNADPSDGASMRAAILSLLNVAQDPKPGSAGAIESAAIGANRRHRGDPATDTADWKDEPGPGNLRIDYVLPSQDWEVVGSGVFWPAKGDPLRRLVGDGEVVVSSDHRLVWVDIR